MKIFLYTANIFHLGQEVMFTKHKRNYEQDFLLDQKSYNIKTYTCNTTD